MSALLDAHGIGGSVRSTSRSSFGMFEVTFDAQAKSLSAIRYIVRGHLRWWCVGDEVTERLLYAINELLTNVVEHASPDERGRRRAELVILRIPEGVTAVVRDEEPGSLVTVAAGPTAERGRGLTLVRALVDAFDVSPTERGKDICIYAAVPATTKDY